MNGHSDERNRGDAAWVEHYERVERRRQQSGSTHSRRGPSSRTRRWQVTILAVAILSVVGAAFVAVMAP